MGRLRQLSEHMDTIVAEARGFVIGSRGLQPGMTGVLLQPNTEYYLGASSSPTHIIVTSVTDEAIEYVQGPDYKRKLRMERWIAEDLIMKGTQTWIDTWGKESYPWVRESLANLKRLLRGEKGKTVKVEDFLPIRVTVEPVGKTPMQAWRDAERYGGVGGQTDHLIIDMRKGGLDDLKKDKLFKILKVEDL